ncbi:MAG TPA: hypothetical protein VMT46_14960 [Anaerolineaceae bacterium]|nr:hypothetical protein [Anaerolineaceae bacterium]
MKTNVFCLLLASFVLLLTAACNYPGNSTPVVITVVVQPTSIPPTEIAQAPSQVPPTQEATSTVGIPSTGEDTPAPNPPTQTVEPAGPQCTIQQNVNLRKGPGKVYDPPVTSFAKGAVVIPTGYQAQGFPGGAWVQVNDPASNTTGWISAGPQFIVCTVDMTALGTADFPPTPKPSIPTVTNSQPQGVFDGFTWKLHFSPSSYLMRMEVFTGDGGKKDGDHIQQVVFTVRDSGGNVVREQVEDHAPYCVFGGTDGCANWPKSNGKYTWGNGKPEVKDGETYNVNIDATADDGVTFANWHFDLKVDLP